MSDLLLIGAWWIPVALVVAIPALALFAGRYPHEEFEPDAPWEDVELENTHPVIEESA